jgi:hypothetical protein
MPLLTFVISSYKLGPDYFGFMECTGATGIAQGCGGTHGGVTCHQYATTLNNVVVELDSAGTAVKSYYPGHSYTVKISGTNGTGDSLPYFGFQITAALLAGYGDTTTVRQAGTWDSTSLPPSVHYLQVARDNTCVTCSFYNIAIIEHDNAILATTGNGLNGTTYMESFTWSAPASGTGSVVLSGYINATRGVDSATRDYYQGYKDTITEAVVSGITALTDKVSGFSVYPTLMNDNITLAFDLKETSTVSVTMISMQGQQVKALLAQELMGTGPFKRSFDVNGLATGIYLVRLQIGNESLVSKVIKE